MFKFEAKQAVYTIGNLTIGGQPGEFPTALFASVFYSGDRLVLDEQAGIFDEEGALRSIDAIRKAAETACIGLAIDLIGGSPAAMSNYVAMMGKTDLTFLIDGTTSDVRLAGAQRAVELGIQGRAIYNSIGPETKADEIDALKELGLKTTIVMAHNARKPTAQGRVSLAEQLVERAGAAGFSQFLFDTAVLDIVDAGPASRAIWELKNRYGYPAGCSPTHTVRSRWKNGWDKFGSLGYAAAKTSLATMTIPMGADYIMFGIKQPEIVPALAMVDAAVAYAAKQHGIRPKTDRHPLYRLFAS